MSHHLSPSSLLIWDESDVVQAVGYCITCNPLVSIISTLGSDSLQSADGTQVYVEPLPHIVIPGSKVEK